MVVPRMFLMGLSEVAVGDSLMSRFAKGRESKQTSDKAPAGSESSLLFCHCP